MPILKEPHSISMWNLICCHPRCTSVHQTKLALVWYLLLMHVGHQVLHALQQRGRLIMHVKVWCLEFCFGLWTLQFTSIFIPNTKCSAPHVAFSHDILDRNEVLTLAPRNADCWPSAIESDCCACSQEMPVCSIAEIVIMYLLNLFGALW